MQRSEPENGRHSTPAKGDMRPRQWLRVMLSLSVFGLLVGLMIGRLTAPEPTRPHLLAVEMQEQELLLRFDQPVDVRAGHLEGALALTLDADGSAQQGQGRLGDLPLRWRIQRQERGLLLSLVSTRPLRGTWNGASDGDQWRLTISPQAE